MALNPNALVTVADAKSYLGIPSADNSFDGRIESMVNAASQLIEDHCDRVFGFASYTIRRDGRRADRLVLPEYPVYDILNVWDDPSWSFAPASLIDSTEYLVEEESILVLKSGRKFSRANGNIKVEFRAGYRLPGGLIGPILPATLSQACLMLVAWLEAIRHDRRVGVSSKSKAGESIGFSEVELPLMVQKLLDDHVRSEIPLLDSPTGNA